MEKLAAKNDRKDSDSAVNRLVKQVGRLITTTDKVNKTMLATKRRNNPRTAQGPAKKQRTAAAADKDKPSRSGNRGRTQKGRSGGKKHCDFCYDKGDMCKYDPSVGKWETHNTVQCESMKKQQ